MREGPRPSLVYIVRRNSGLEHLNDRPSRSPNEFRWRTRSSELDVHGGNVFPDGRTPSGYQLYTSGNLQHVGTQLADISGLAGAKLAE